MTDEDSEVEQIEQLTDVSGVDEETADQLRWADYGTVEDLRAATRNDLASVDGITPPLAEHIKADVGGVDRESPGGDATGAREDPEAKDGDADWELFGLRWYHLALVGLLSVQTLLSGPSFEFLVIAVVSYFLLVLVLTKASRRLQEWVRQPTGAAGTSADHEGRTHREGGATTPDRSPDFEEALSPRPAGRQLLAGVAFMAIVLVAVLTVFTVLSVAQGYGSSEFFGGIGAVVIAVVGMLAVMSLPFYGFQRYHSSRTLYDLRVTDEGVEVEGKSSVLVPFEAITRVQYSEPTGSHVQVTREDKEAAKRSMKEADGLVTPNTWEHSARRFLVTPRPFTKPPNMNYRGGVRIERADRPPVYVGSERPVELASIIAEKAPGVEGIERL